MPDNNKLEREQSVLRLALGVLVIPYILLVGNIGGIPTETIHVATEYMFANLFVSMLLGVFVWREIINKVVRRLIGMILDIACVTVIMYYLADYGAPLFTIYLFVTIGNGFRYGVKYMAVCALLSIICFSYLSVISAFWQELYLVVISGISVLTVVPAYVAVLLNRLTMEKERAEIANKEKTRFLANVSHEIRTPLNAVVGFSEILGKPGNEGRQAQIIRNIKDASKSLMSLVEGVLDFSRIESGHVRIKKETFNLYALVYSIEGMFSIRTERRGIRYITDMDISTPLYIKGDVDRLRQVLVNLVGNAVKFTTTGEVRLKVRHVPAGEPGEQLVFEVIDTGIGIEEGAQARIFERFRQADDSVQREYGGTGLGTAIAKRLVELMGGCIGFESVRHQGSRFWFRIPLRSVAERDYPEYKSADIVPDYCVLAVGEIPSHVPASARVFRNRSELDKSGVALNELCLIVDCHDLAEENLMEIANYGRTAGACMVACHEDDSRRDMYLDAGFHLVINSYEYIDNVLQYASRILESGLRTRISEDFSRRLQGGKQLKVLVADDCRLNRRVLLAMLDELGVESDFASSGPMALEMLQADTYDLLMLDIQMPGMSGFDVIETYQSAHAAEELVPIMVITGDATTEIHDECERLGVARFLLKPVDQEMLRDALVSLIAPAGTQYSPVIA